MITGECSAANPHKVSLFLLCVIAAAGCATNKSVKVDQSAGRSVVVVPVAGQPITLIKQSAGSLATEVVVGVVGAAGGVAGQVAGSAAGSTVGPQAEDARAEPEKTVLSERLNRLLPDFRPEQILAQECVAILQSSSSAVFRNVALSPDTAVMDGAGELLKHEPKPFKPSPLNHAKWGSLGMRWRKSPPSAGAASLGPSGQDKLALEVAFFYVLLNHGDSLEVALCQRLTDPAKGQILGMTGFLVGQSKITPVTQTSDPAVFVKDFRRSVNELARQALKALKLI